MPEEPTPTSDSPTSDGTPEPPPEPPAPRDPGKPGTAGIQPGDIESKEGGSARGA